MFVDENQVWLKRWESLDSQIDEIASQYEAGNVSWHSQLLKNLRDFGKKQFLYFYFGFYHVLLDGLEKHKHEGLDKGLEYAKKKKAIFDIPRVQNALMMCGTTANASLPQRLIYDDAFPPQFVLRSIIDQMTYDLDVIQRALSYRNMPKTKGTTVAETSPKNEQDWAEMDGQIATLKLADLFGDKLLSHKGVEGNLLENKPQILTYFHRSPHIRMIPYDNVALIGIPYTTTKAGFRKDLLVMAHEVGHHVYWHGYVGKQRVRDVLNDVVRGELPVFRNWIEEIFADVFGLIVSEELAILPWVIDMLQDNSPGMYIRDNQIHPIDAIRPYIYLEALKFVAQAGEKEYKFFPRVPSFIVPVDNSKEALKRLDGYIILLKEAIVEHHRQMGNFPKIRVKNRLGDTEPIELDELIMNLGVIVAKLINATLITPKQQSSDWVKNWKTRIESLWSPEDVTEFSSKLDINYPAKLYLKKLDRSIAEQLAEIPFNEVSAAVKESFFKDIRLRKILDWEGDFERTIKDIGVKEIEVDEEVAAHQTVRYFEKIRDNSFDLDVTPDIWRIVFAADGWTIKGPDSHPTGDFEGDWHRSSFHP